METIYTCSVRGRLSDRSRVLYEGRISTFQPAPADRDLEDAIEQFGLMGLAKNVNRQSRNGDYIHDSDSRFYDERPICDDPYPGIYTGKRPESIIDSQYTASSSRRTARPSGGQKMIEYPQQPIIDSINPSLSSRHPKTRAQRYASSASNHQTSQFRDLKHVDEVNNPKAMERYVYGGNRYDDELEPTDSISCVSSRRSGVSTNARRHQFTFVPREERRGKSMIGRGDGQAPTVYSGTTVLSRGRRTGGGRSYFDSRAAGQCGFDLDERAETQYYETREIRPDY